MTKAQQKLQERYRKQLQKCGFRSWRKANERRCDLIHRKIDRTATVAELAELSQLQKLAGIYQRWKTNDYTKRAIRQLQRKLKKLQA